MDSYEVFVVIGMEMIQSFIVSTMLDKKMDILKRKCQFLESKKDDIEEELKHEESSGALLQKSPFFFCFI